MFELHQGDCLEVLRTLAIASVDAVVTDPPAGIAFMGKAWDKNKGGRDQWVAWLAERLAECLRVAKPGAHLLCWGLPRTSHWTGMAIEDAGWLIEDRITHHFGTGFPKGKAKLKPSTEDWWLATKPGGAKWLNVDVCRIPAPEGLTLGGRSKGSSALPMNRVADVREDRDRSDEHTSGRWPTNLVLSHSPECNGECVEGCPVREMGEQSGEHRSGGKAGIKYKTDCIGSINAYGKGIGKGGSGICVSDSGTAARFFPTFIYQAKATRADRNAGCEGMTAKRKRVAVIQTPGFKNYGDADEGGKQLSSPMTNHHPTVKATPLMQWLCRLVTPPEGVILDPFAGSGSTGNAAIAEGFGFIGIEQDGEYLDIAEARMHSQRLPLFDPEVKRV